MWMRKWIDVAEQLPEDRQRVLTYCPEDIFVHYNLTIDVHTYYADYAGSGAWFIGSQNYPVGEGITHWAELPPGPGE